MTSLQTTKLVAIMIMVISALGVLIGIFNYDKYNYILFISSAFLIGMVAYSYYIGREQEKRKEENTRRKLK